MSYSLVVLDAPTAADRRDIVAPLDAYNLAQAGPGGWLPSAIMIRDEESARNVGGLWGWIAYDWLHIELIAVPEDARGQGHGRTLMQMAERMARERGCVGIDLDTFEFQARGFYEKLGFEVFGVLDDHPKGQKRFFMKKRLDA